MSNQEILTQVNQKAQKWLEGKFDDDTKAKVNHLMEHDQNELIESFYKDLEFGTGGLRGIMGVGTNRMNIYTVGMATQGLCNYLKKNFGHLPIIKVAVAYDCRNNSRLFAETTANICSANGMKAYLFESLRPTPELSFAVRHFGCQGGVVITASHNPKEYNGYKAYWDDGAQVIEPHDENIVNEFLKLSIDDVNFKANPSLIEIIGDEIDKLYLQKIKGLSLSPEAIHRQKNMKIVYTPLHGTGVKLVPAALKNAGFNNVFHVAEQDVNDGNFPTVNSPNPENGDALEMAINKAKEVGADLVMASDPDADRVGVAIKNSHGEFILLNGNQTAALLTYYIISKWVDNKKLTNKEFIVKTIVTSELLIEIAKKHRIEYFDVLTGFKYIADIIRTHEGKKTFICGGEESYGFLIGDFVRDKDAISACAMIAETAAWAKDNGKSLYDLLLKIYVEYGLYKESLINITKKGKSGAEEIAQMLTNYRNHPPTEINGSKIVIIKDYQLSHEIDCKTGKITPINLPKSNVLQFFTADESKITIRPSGTEPKIKFYFGVKGQLNNIDEYETVNLQLDSKIKAIIESMQLQ